jgi:ribosomal protein S18 acetylase RimI-like enzyme
MIDFQVVTTATETDVVEVARLAAVIWREHYVPIIGRAQVDYMLAQFQSETAIAAQIADGYEYYLIVYQSQNAGYAAVVADMDASSLLLSKIYVEKSLRGHGLGKKALEFIEDLCRQRGIGTIWLTVNKNNAASIAWYERVGFINAGPIVQDIGGGFVMDDFKMEKKIG